MKLSELEQNGGIASDEAVPFKRIWNDAEVEFRVKKLPFGDIERITSITDLDTSKTASLIAKAIVLDEGETLDYKTAYTLVPSLAEVFVEAIVELNGLGNEAELTDPLGSSQSKNSGST